MWSELRRKAIEGLEAGDTCTWSRTITPEDVAAFGDLTRDYNPVHYDQRFAQAKGYRAPISHGLLVGGMLCEIGGQWGWLATQMHFRFLRPVYSGDTVTATLTIVELDEAGHGRAEVDYINQDGEQVVSAWFSGRLPLEPEKEVMRQMLAEGDPTNKLR